MKKLIAINSVVIGTFAFLAGLVSLWLFKMFYLACPEFNSEGRCFDATHEVVYHEESFYWLPIGLIALLVGVSLLLLSRWCLKRKKSRKS